MPSGAFSSEQIMNDKDLRLAGLTKLSWVL
jgi:hypothetical protein